MPAFSLHDTSYSRFIHNVRDDVLTGQEPKPREQKGFQIDTYAVGDRQGHVIKYLTGEFMIIEPQPEDAFSLAWSSEVAVRPLVTEVVGILDPRGSFVEGIVHHTDDTEVEGHSQEVLASIENSPADTDFLRLDSSQFAFGWRSDVKIANIDNNKSINEFGFISTTTFDPELYKQLLLATGTESLKTDVDELSDKITALLK